MYPENTKKVAEMCLECGACSKICDYIPRFCPEGPKKKAEEFLDGKYVVDQITPFSCTLCGKCSTICREKLNIGEMMLEVRQKIMEEDLPLPGFIKMVAKNQKFATGEEFFLRKAAPSGKTKYLFFPGCGLSGYSGELVTKTWKWLNDNVPDCGLLLTCCGAPNFMSGDSAAAAAVTERIKKEMSELGAETLICACPDCQDHFLKETDIPVTNLYAVMEPLWDKKTVGDKQKRWMMHDPCKSRPFPEMQDAVRSLMDKAGYEVAEPDKFTKKRTQCCGQGGLVSYTDAKWAGEIQKKRADAFTEDFVTYCGACRQTLRGQGKLGVHVLDLLFTEDLEAAKNVPHNNPVATKKAQINTKMLLEES